MPENKIISKKEAKQKGLKRYFTNKICKYNHVAERLCSNNSCVICSKIKYDDWRKENPEKSKHFSESWKLNNYEKNRLTAKNWNLKNRNHKLYLNSKRRSLKLKATAKWANQEKIKKIYLNCPSGYEVDHIIPLQGKTICGLHVENNLQYLTKSENSKKGNRYD